MIETAAIIEDLKAGNQRFLEGSTVNSPELSLQRLRQLAIAGQNPQAIVLCCSDARAPCEMVFDQKLGDLFVIRVAGNIVAPSLVGSVEFAASTFGTRLVVVMGHTLCGAIAATLDQIENPISLASDNIRDIVNRIRPHIFTISQISGMSREDKLNLAVRANVEASISQLSHSSRLIENLVGLNRITIVGAILDLATGRVQFLE